MVISSHKCLGFSILSGNHGSSEPLVWGAMVISREFRSSWTFGGSDTLPRSLLVARWSMVHPMHVYIFSFHQQLYGGKSVSFHGYSATNKSLATVKRGQPRNRSPWGVSLQLSPQLATNVCCYRGWHPSIGGSVAFGMRPGVDQRQLLEWRELEGWLVLACSGWLFWLVVLVGWWVPVSSLLPFCCCRWSTNDRG